MSYIYEELQLYMHIINILYQIQLNPNICSYLSVFVESTVLTSGLCLIVDIINNQFPYGEKKCIIYFTSETD